MSKFLILCLIVGCLFMAGSPIFGGTVADDLDLIIQSAQDKQLIRVIIVPVSDNINPTMKSSLAERYPKRSDRHRAGMEILQAQAANTQGPVVSILNDLKSRNLASSTKQFWIANLIEAKVSASEIYKLASSNSVDKIYAYPEIVSVPVPTSSYALKTAGNAEANLISIKADSAWAMGFDGRGRLVCSFDSGVDGLHPTLSGNYRGNMGYPADECWFSPTDSSEYPHPFSSAGSSRPHGTHTTGIMVGHDDASGDTIGVAPGAQWIAAVAIDVPGVSIFEAFQWAADPDGDPNTVSDLPDVINHSWGVPGIGCADLFWDLIDNVEALGVVNIFAAGNEGPLPFTIRNPANRAEDSITNFAVGAINISDSALWSQPGYASSQGPSDCDSISIKPNITAPGASIRSAVPGIGFDVRSGTSMAAPHVSGVVAILRQKNPDATVDEIKTALLNSAYDFGPAGPDNSYGWGILDVMEAMRQIDSLTTPSIRVENMIYPEIMPGDIINVDFHIINVGANAPNVIVHFDNADPEINLITDSILYFDIDTDVVSAGDRTLDIEFTNSTENGRFYSLDMFILINGTLHKQKRLSFFVGSKGERNYFHHDTGLVKFTISNYGAYGFFGTNGTPITGSFIPMGFEGFRYNRSLNDLHQGAFMIGVDSSHVSDCVRNIVQQPDNDFAVQEGGSIQSFSPGLVGDQETISRFDDSWAENPIGLSIQQKTYGWADSPNDGFIIIEYVITNISGGFISGIRAGLFFDWDIKIPGSNHGSFLPEQDLTYLCYSNSTDSADFRGVRILNPEGMTNHFIFEWWTDLAGSNLTEAKKYKALSDNSSGSFSSLADVSHVTATGPFNLADGQSDTAVFAVVAGLTWDDFIQNATQSKIKYGDFHTDIDDYTGLNLPRKFSLDQNFPNPFNPTTTISFSVPRAGEAAIEIFDILGRKIRTVFEGTLPAGEKKIVWDGLDESGQKVASGIYFYRVRFDNNSLTKKMILMK